MVLEATSRSQPGTATRGKTNSSTERRLRGRLDWRTGRWRGAWARGEGGGRSVRGAGNYPGPLSGPRRCSPDTLGWEESGLLEPEGNVGRLYTGCLPVHRSSFFFLAAIDEPWTSFASLDQPKTPQPGATLIRRRIRGHSSCCTDPNFRSRIPRDRQARKKAIGRFRRFKNMKAIWLMVLLAGVAVDAQRRLALPDPRSCANRVRHSSYRDARGVAHSYFFSWEHQPTRSLEVDWLDSRNICRRHCMDAVSLETPQENEFIKQRVVRGNVRYIWTSGRKCNFNGCDRPDLQPQNVNGWFWSGSGAKIGPTSQRNSGDWSNTGGYGQPQPDNREAAQGNDESCLSILNNFYNDGIKWHDVACHHRKPFVCEDSDELLNFVASRNPGIRL